MPHFPLSFYLPADWATGPDETLTVYFYYLFAKNLLGNILNSIFVLSITTKINHES